MEVPYDIGVYSITQILPIVCSILTNIILPGNGFITTQELKAYGLSEEEIEAIRRKEDALDAFGSIDFDGEV